MRVGSLHNPWEYDDRLPPDAGYYLDLVLPRKEEPRKKIGSRARLLHGRMLQIQWSNYMQLYSRLSANLLAISVKILVSLLVKLTKLGQGGPSGPGLQGSTNSRCSACSSLCCVAPRQLIWGGHGSLRSYLFVRLWDHSWDYGDRRDKKEKNGYPFTTFSRFFRLSWDRYRRVFVGWSCR